MEIVVSSEVINTVCNSLRASKYSLIRQLAKANEERKSTAIIASQLIDVEEALRVFEYFMD